MIKTRYGIILEIGDKIEDKDTGIMGEITGHKHGVLYRVKWADKSETWIERAEIRPVELGDA